MSATLAPDDIVATHAEGAANEREPLLVLEPLREFLRAGGLDAPVDLSAVPVGDGHSNVTFGLSTGVVLRRPPRGPLPPSAHDVLREARLLAALEPTSVRTPRVLAVCDDPGVIGAPFYVMERDPGGGHHRGVPAALDTPEHRGRIADELVDALVELHATDWTRSGWRDSASRPGTSSASCGGSTDCGSTTARARSRSSTRSARGWPTTFPSLRRPRSSTATTGSATRCSPRAPRRDCPRSWTGRWRRSATRWPTSAT